MKDKDLDLKLSVYLAGYSEERRYREFVEKVYGDKLILLNPMTITHLDVIDVTPEMKHANNAWVKFHTKKSFDSIENCFDFILSK